MKHLRQYIKKLLKEQTGDEFETPGDEQALEEFELAEKIILAFFQSANQGITLAAVHPNEETSSVLTDIFTVVRDDIKSFTQVTPASFKGRMTDQLRYGEKAEAIGEDLLNIAVMAGWESWMPQPNDLNKSTNQFFKDFHKSFRVHWFVNLPEQKQQEWIDWLGGDL